jgi:hypothetical protein
MNALEEEPDGTCGRWGEVESAGTGGAARQGAQTMNGSSLPGTPVKRHKASMRVQSFSLAIRGDGGNP